MYFKSDSSIIKIGLEASFPGPLIPPAQEITQLLTNSDLKTDMLKKLRGGFLLVIGYLLSPACWWNDLLFNLPIAYFFGSLFSWFSPQLFLPASIAGYWLTNIVGILMMQFGTLDMFQNQSQDRNLGKEILNGCFYSTLYTILIVILIQFKVLETPILFSAL